MSEIKLLRFICKSFSDVANDNIGWKSVNLGFLDLSIMSYDNSFSYRYGSRIYEKPTGISNPFIYYTVGNQFLMVPNHVILITNMSEFLDSDDISLVLRHGRDILDENIIKLFNSRLSSNKISLSDFEPIF